MIERPNGCGPKGWFGKLIPDHLFGLSVKSACDYHDQQYIQGGSSQQRKLADQIFLKEMLEKIKQKNDSKVISFSRKVGAYSYYWGVCFLGKYFFKKDISPNEKV